MSKKDCFAYIREGVCFGLTKMNCEGCNFYKHSDNPNGEKDRINKDIENYKINGVSKKN